MAAFQILGGGVKEAVRDKHKAILKRAAAVPRRRVAAAAKAGSQKA